jgi:hypothetical protein
MESLDDSKLSSKLGFFKYLFKFDDDIKGELLNISQYSLLSFIPVIILNKAMQRFVPEADEEKGSLEILAEVIIQIIVMFIFIFYINRIVMYVPAYSGIKYPEFNVIYIILAVLVITMSLQTKLGEKVSILFDRVSELWDGTDKKEKAKGKKGNGKGTVKVSQTISGQQPNTNTEAMGNSLYRDTSQGTTSISQLPEYQQQQHPQQQQQQMGQMGQDNGGMIMAANEVLGGSGFGTTF